MDAPRDDARAPVRGLEGVVAGETQASYVDGVNGMLIYRGYDIHDLAENALFAEVVYLMWYGRLPNAKELADFRVRIVSEMRLPSQVIQMINLAPRGAHPMDVLRTAVSALAMFDPDTGDMSPEANDRKRVRLLAQMMTIFAASRTAGWLAYVKEQYADNRLIRPTSKYVGPWRLEVQPISER